MPMVRRSASCPPAAAWNRWTRRSTTDSTRSTSKSWSPTSCWRRAPGGARRSCEAPGCATRPGDAAIRRSCDLLPTDQPPARHAMWCLQLLQAWFRRLSWPPARRLLLARRSSWSRSSSADFGASLIDERGHQRGGEGADTVGPASWRRGGRCGGEGPAEAVVRGGGQPMSRTWQRILTAKALALSALLVAVATAGTERQLDADSSWHPRHEGYPPHVKPGW